MIDNDLIENVQSNPNINAAEKETTMTMYGDEKELSIFSAKATVVKSLIRNDHFEPEWVGGDDGSGYTTVEPSQAHTLNAIYSISGTAPVGLLTVKSKPRSNNNQSSIVNWKGVDPDAFA